MSVCVPIWRSPMTQVTLHFRSVKLSYCFPLSFCDDNTFYRYFSPFHPLVDPLHSTGGGEFGVQKWCWLVSFPHLLPPVVSTGTTGSGHFPDFQCRVIWSHTRLWSPRYMPLGHRYLFTGFYSPFLDQMSGILGPGGGHRSPVPPAHAASAGGNSYHGNRSEVSGTNVQAYFSSSCGRFDGF